MNDLQENYKWRFRALSLWCASLVTLFGFLVLLGWLLDLNVLKGGLAAGITVKTNCGLAFLLSGVTLLLYIQTEDRRDGSAIGRALGLAVFAIGASTLSQHLFSWDLGIDQLLFDEPRGEAATTSPNRMGPPASISFTLLGIAFLLLHSGNAARRELATKVALSVGLFALLPLLGYIFGTRQLYGIAHFTGIALPTAIALLLISTACVLGVSTSNFVQLLSADDAGGVLARRLLPPAIALPPLLGYLRLKGWEQGLYDQPFGRSLLVLAFILIFAQLVWSSARRLQRADHERMDLIERERAARSRAERANRAKDDFLATISHELRTPLNAILGWVQLLKRTAVAPDVLKGLNTIERNSRLQAQLIEDLLDMSRIISGKLRLDPQRVEIGGVLTAAVQTVEADAAARAIGVRMNSVAPSAFVNGDPNRLQQVFWNILVNALKFTPDGGEVTVCLEILDGNAVVSISDTGQGIEEKNLSYIFERFAQADSSMTRKFGGLGIGLSLVRDLVELHRGSVTAKSSGPGLGSTFTVTIPLAADAGACQLGTLAVKDGLDQSLSDIAVLVVDDDKDALEITNRILTNCGAVVSLAHSADEALDSLSRCMPDILVSDIGMPGRDGYQLIETIRGMPGALERGLPAIALTAFVREQDKARAVQSGFQLCLSKPIDAVELTAAINELARAQGVARHRTAIDAHRVFDLGTHTEGSGPRSGNSTRGTSTLGDAEPGGMPPLFLKQPSSVDD